MIAIAAVAADVPGLTELGVSVVPIYGRHPYVVAGQALSLQTATGGRFVLGLGPSHRSMIEGILTGDASRPFTVTQEFLQALAPLLVRHVVADLPPDTLPAAPGLDIDADPC